MTCNYKLQFPLILKRKISKPKNSSSGPTLKCQTCQTAVSPVKARLEFAKSQFLHLHCHPQQSAQKESQPQRPPAQLQLTSTTCFSSRSNEYARGYDYLSVGSSLLGLRDCTAPRFYPPQYPGPRTSGEMDETLHKIQSWSISTTQKTQSFSLICSNRAIF